MKEASRVRLEIRTHTKGHLRLPHELLETAGFMSDGKPGRIRYVVDGEGVSLILDAKYGHVPERAKDGSYLADFTPTRIGVSGKAREPLWVAVAAAPGRIEIMLPHDIRAARRVADGEDKPRVGPAWQNRTTTFLEATAGTHGAARALALDAYRSEHATAYGVELGQLVDMLRNAGHRVEQLGPRLFRLDGETASLADLTERARRIDADAVLVAEAA